MGWNYWYNWTIVLPAELSAAALLMGFWKSVRFGRFRRPFYNRSLTPPFLDTFIQKEEVNPAVWITMCLVIVIFINLLGAGKP